MHETHLGGEVAVDGVYKKRAGDKYGKRLWVIFGGSAYRGGYEFDPKDYWGCTACGDSHASCKAPPKMK